MARTRGIFTCLYLAVMTSLCVYTSAEMEFHRIRVLTNGVPVAEDVLYDKNNKVAILNVNGERDGNTSICQSSNFHDLERHILALKQVKSGKCYLVNTNETTSDIESLFDQGKIHQARLLSYIARKDKVPVEDVEAQAGKKIANFCKDYDTYWLVDTADERRDVERSERKAPCYFACGICFFSIECKFIN